MDKITDATLIAAIEALRAGFSRPIPDDPAGCPRDLSEVLYRSRKTADEGLSAVAKIAGAVAAARLQGILRLLMAWPAAAPEDATFADYSPDAMGLIAAYRESRPDGTCDDLAPIADALLAKYDPDAGKRPACHEGLIDAVWTIHANASSGNLAAAADGIPAARKAILALIPEEGPRKDVAYAWTARAAYEACARELDRAGALLKAAAGLPKSGM